MRPETSLDARYFDDVFDGNDDPWQLASSDYERAKFAATIAALDDRRYPRGCEIGCAHGILTERLATVCDDLLAIDISARAIVLAQARCRGLAGVRFAVTAFPGESPGGTFDLAILSEVAYYWSDADLVRAADWVARHVVVGGRLILVHWTGETDYPQTGDDAVTKLAAALGDRIRIERADRGDGYRLDRWRRA